MNKKRRNKVDIISEDYSEEVPSSFNAPLKSNKESGPMRRDKGGKKFGGGAAMTKNKFKQMKSQEANYDYYMNTQMPNYSVPQ